MKKDMQHVLSSMSKRRTILVAWLTVWMVAVPLVHVHPEVDHRHGEPGHAHGGIPHTVFSSDLPCEYGSNDGRAESSPAKTGVLGPVVGQASHVFDHPEVGFSLLTSSPDRNSGKPALAQVAPLVAGDGCVRQASVFAAKPSVEPLASVILSANLSSRAPPLPAV